MKKLLTVYLLFICSGVFSQQADKFIRQGNEYYKKLEFGKAESEYSKAVAAVPSGTNAKFNLGNALYKQNKQGEAIKQFDDIVSNAGKDDLKAKSYYNKGVVLSNQKKLEESIEAYKNSLRQNPNDKEARENLQKALLELKKKNPPKPKQDPKKKKQEQPKSAMDRKEAEQRLQLLAQKEKEVQQRIQKEKSKTGGSQSKDW